MQRSRRMNEYAALFLFSALMGLLGQTFIPWLSGQLNSRYLDFWFVVSNIDVYPFAVVALITFKNAEPKKALFRILAFFSGCAWAITDTQPSSPPPARSGPETRVISRTSCPTRRMRLNTWSSRCARAYGGSSCRGLHPDAFCTGRCWRRSS